jgi:hypothetical protein
MCCDIGSAAGALTTIWRRKQVRTKPVVLQNIIEQIAALHELQDEIYTC